MSARDAIERLLYDYCWGIDHGDFELTASLFGEAGLYGLVGGPAASGADQVLATMNASTRKHPDPGRQAVPRTRHVVTNVVIDVADDEQSGTARSYVQVLHQSPSAPGEPREPIRPIIAGTYHDRVHLVDGMWQFAERRMHIELIGDLTTHLQPGFL